ncbi:MAG: histidine phosphatase family protein, partial [Ketobacteraceae bacterium]|nr:histidine phosphatase family protein [Ketobacteraceae bacterium]
HNFFAQVKADRHYAPTGGESIQAVTTRVSRALEEIATRHRGEKVVAVSHGAAMALALAHLFHRDPYAWEQYHFHNTGVTEVVIGAEPRLLRFNCYAHLGTE